MHETNLKKICNEISEAVFPSNIYCELCGALIDRSRPYSLCDECVRKMHWITGGIQPDGSVQRTCRKCGKALPETYRGEMCYDCMGIEHYFTRGWSCLTYGYHERQIMMGIKYSGKGYLATKMGDVLFDKMKCMIAEAEKKGIMLFDMVIPVPVSRKRLVKRGYNQSELMARQFMRRWKEQNQQSLPVPPLETGILVRLKETEMLRSLGPAARRLAISGAFGVNSKKKVGRNVLLIDDIYTTGATADACSKVLLENGADDVYLLTLCSGGNRKPDIDPEEDICEADIADEKMNS